ncbi:hypothetical protein DFJ74DRAFT_426356 [Hyaloraphidium curvatum]|nr:hypothetical protein DFJ74DRAFT_426356 [Hyaloraphidium curvatum]
MSHAAAASKPAAALPVAPAPSSAQTRVSEPASADTRFAPSDTKRMFIMRGAPGSGKSFLAKQILGLRTAGATSRGVILSTDDYFDQDGRYVFDRTLLGAAHEWNRQRCESECERELGTVIVDNTNVCRWEARPYVELALRYGYEVQVLEPSTPWWIARSVPDLIARNTHGVPEESIRGMLDRWEPGPWDIESILRSERPGPPPHASRSALAR